MIKSAEDSAAQSRCFTEVRSSPALDKWIVDHWINGPGLASQIHATKSFCCPQIRAAKTNRLAWAGPVTYYSLLDNSLCIQLHSRLASTPADFNLGRFSNLSSGGNRCKPPRANMFAHPASASYDYTLALKFFSGKSFGIIAKNHSAAEADGAQIFRPRHAVRFQINRAGIALEVKHNKKRGNKLL